MLSIYNFLKVKLCYRTYWKQWLTLLAICLLVFACSGGDGDSDDPNNPCPNQPQLTTLEVSNIGIDENTDLASATFSGEIQNIQLGANCETFSITNQGFVYSTNIQPTTSDNVVNANGENASANVSNLMPETTYYVRAYLTNTLGTFYGNEVNFATPQSTNPIYLAENGVTIKARDWANIGDIGVINGIEYTVVNEDMLTDMISNNEDVSSVCTTRINWLVNEVTLGWNANTTDLSTWDTSNVYSMSGISISFDTDVSYWDVSSVTNMSRVFMGEFNSPLNNWDVSNVTNMDMMFWQATSFNQDISNWDVSNVTNMSHMFALASSFNQDISNWDLSNVIQMMYMFQEAISFNQDLSNWAEHITQVNNMIGMFYNNTTYNQDLSSWFNGTGHSLGAQGCGDFCYGATSWTLPKPNFYNCGDSECD